MARLSMPKLSYTSGIPVKAGEMGPSGGELLESWSMLGFMVPVPNE